MTQSPPAASTANGSALHSSAFFTFEKQSASLNDLEIVRKIVEREGCLEALEQLLTAKKTKPKSDKESDSLALEQAYPYRFPRKPTATTSPLVVQSLLDQLRSVSVQIVEAIEKWKASNQMQVFQWRHVNYLLKMVTDVNFLASVPIQVDALQRLRLERNPFLAPLHLDHAAVREKVPDAATLLGHWVGDVDMKRIFYASKVLVRELEMEKQKQLMGQQEEDDDEEEEDQAYECSRDAANNSTAMAIVVPSVLAAAKHQQQIESSAAMRVRWSNQDVKVLKNRSTSSSVSLPHSKPQLETDREDPKTTKDAMNQDLELGRELILHAEHELGAIREELAILQDNLVETLLPEKRRKLQNRIGVLVNTLKFKSGDLYQRKNELRRKEAVFRLAACERTHRHPPSSSGKLTRSDKSSTRQLDTAPAVNNSPESSHHHPYLSAVSGAMQEDELHRQEIVERFATLAKMKAASTSRQKHKKQHLARNAYTPSPCKSGLPLGTSNPSPALHTAEMSSSLRHMTTENVAKFIDSLDLGCEYGAKFQAQGIDGALLQQANDQDLEEVGVSIRLHRVRILEAIDRIQR